MSLKMSYKIHSIPRVISQSYELACLTEGNLCVEVDGDVLFDEDGILIIEFGMQLRSWIASLKGGEEIDFNYTSMDFEEDPVLRFGLYSPGVVELSSVWQKGSSPALRIEVVAEVARNFLKQLKEDLLSSHGIDFDSLV